MKYDFTGSVQYFFLVSQMLFSSTHRIFWISRIAYRMGTRLTIHIPACIVASRFVLILRCSYSFCTTQKPGRFRTCVMMYLRIQRQVTGKITNIILTFLNAIVYISAFLAQRCLQLLSYLVSASHYLNRAEFSEVAAKASKSLRLTLHREGGISRN